jgi:hypothetical protein
MHRLLDLAAVQERSPDPVKQLLWGGTVVPISGTSRQVGAGILILCVMWLCACSEYVTKETEGVGQSDDSPSGVEFGNADDAGTSGGTGTSGDAGTTTPKESCGNAVCDATESCANCPKDCGWCAGCGDGACDGGDTTANCPQDCGSKCGDGVCNGPEYPQSCPQDCKSQVPPQLCEPGANCITLSPGNVGIDLKVEEGMAPALNGGQAPSGHYFLHKVRVYPDSLSLGEPFPIELVIQDNGQTHGSAKFEGGAFALSLVLDLHAGFPGLGEESEFVGEGQVGGCAEFEANTLHSNTMECSEGISADFELPEDYPYAVNGNQLKLLVSFKKELLLAQIPEDYMELAAIVFKGDLDILMTFEK